MEAMRLKGRHAHGERVISAKLTDLAVREILECHPAGGVTQAELARRLGVSRSVVCNILRGRAWKHLTTSLVA